MAKRKPKPKMMWRVSFREMPRRRDVGKEKIRNTGYVSHFKTEQEAIDHKWDQLMRIRTQYNLLPETLPEEYVSQIKHMEKEYGKSKAVS